ncbi:D-aminoacyl-tRNA deacylase [Dendrobium catenatum]|uniref:D-aminoacyl-tRNA deacylase n=1 Tax=Dendrobium catenatum TaxID=906689 RepID=A0A2I0VRT0_9ASPA|nr:D-aminoacyl-tRNA deacylase [Dendrobium catenatum]
MVILVVATTADPASIGPASAFLAMPGWTPGPFIDEKIASYANGETRLLKHERSIVAEDDLDRRWQEATGESVSEVIFLSRHTAVSNRPALTVHPIGVPHLRIGDTPPQGGRPAWAAPPNPRVGPWFRLLRKIAIDQCLVPEFEVTLEATHHGPVVSTPTMFLEIGSTEEYWGRQDAAQAIALGLGLDGGNGVGKWDRNSYNKVLLAIGGGHYVPRHMDIIQSLSFTDSSVLLASGNNSRKEGVWVGHLLSGYSLPMEEPAQRKAGDQDKGIGGTWRQSIKVSLEATKSAFPGGVILAHLDQK